jgi:hypothetical protein
MSSAAINATTAASCAAKVAPAGCLWEAKATSVSANVVGFRHDLKQQIMPKTDNTSPSRRERQRLWVRLWPASACGQVPCYAASVASVLGCAGWEGKGRQPLLRCVCGVCGCLWPARSHATLRLASARLRLPPAGCLWEGKATSVSACGCVWRLASGTRSPATLRLASARLRRLGVPAPVGVGACGRRLGPLLHRVNVCGANQSVVNQAVLIDMPDCRVGVWYPSRVHMWTAFARLH